jgi:hypothetical protein
MNKSELIDWLQNEYRLWEELLEQIGPIRMDQPGVNGEWSMKDIVAHLTGWNLWLITRLQSAHRGESEPPPPWPEHLQSEDEINAWIFASNRERSVGDVLDESRQLFQRLFTVMEDFSEDIQIEFVEPKFHIVWIGDQYFPVGEFFYHFHDDHEPDIRTWLARQEQR